MFMSAQTVAYILGVACGPRGAPRSVARPTSEVNSSRVARAGSSPGGGVAFWRIRDGASAGSSFCPREAGARTRVGSPRLQ